MSQDKVKPVKSSLLVLNYAMDAQNPIFSHQLEVVNALAKKFEKIIVISQKVGDINTPSNVFIIDLNWKEGNDFLNSVKFLFFLLLTIWKLKPDYIFSHMTEKLSMLGALPIKIFNIPHFLWYAHASNSLSLKLTSYFVDKIFTSTIGSCPIKSPKVRFLGQAIDTSMFRGSIKNCEVPTRFLHVGRLDESKNLETLIQCFLVDKPDNSLTFIGSPSNFDAEKYWNSLKIKYRELLHSKKLIEMGPVSRSDLPRLIVDYEIFVHAFIGSLDKAILEATACGLPVITLNTEYHSIFGNWAKKGNLNDLSAEYLGFLELSKTERELELGRRAELVRSEHSFFRWIEKLTSEMIS